MNSKTTLNKKLLVTIGIAVTCLFLFIIFPTKNTFQQIFSAVAFLLLTPIFYVKIILKKKLKDYGIRIGDWRLGFVWSAISLLISFLIFYLLFHYSAFPEKYYIYFFKPAVGNFWLFLLYETALVTFFFAIYEFFFRGFLIFSFRESFGIKIIAIQTALFFLSFWLSGGLNWSVVPILIFSPFAGIIAYYSRSILFSFISSFFFNMIIDAAIINVFK